VGGQVDQLLPSQSAWQWVAHLVARLMVDLTGHSAADPATHSVPGTLLPEACKPVHPPACHFHNPHPLHPPPSYPLHLSYQHRYRQPESCKDGPIAGPLILGFSRIAMAFNGDT